MPHLVDHPDVPGVRCRCYWPEEGRALRGQLVRCDMADCPDHLCAEHGTDHMTPHAFNPWECFQSCCHPGRTGMCVPVKAGAK